MNDVVSDQSGPVQIKTSAGWLSHLFGATGLSLHADLLTVQSRMDELANRAAPLTRKWWRRILALQGLTVLIPLAWFVRYRSPVPMGWVALATFATVALFVTVNWWLRWRGMQKTWARSRLVAEVARSFLRTSQCPQLPALQTLEIVPELQPLREIAARSAHPAPLSEWREAYLKNRIEHQWAYFDSRQKEAQRQRARLSRWGTLMLDLALAFAFAGVVIALSPRGQSWRRMLGDFRFEIVLGVAGVVAPLVLLLLQLVRSVQELNRRTARYAQQREMLYRAKARLLASETAQSAMDVVEDTERQLLAEVLEWYFHAETAEGFFVRREKEQDDRTPSLTLEAEPSAVIHYLRRALGITSAAGLFLLRVILGRIPWIVGSGAAALMWIAYQQPSDYATRDQLKVLARLANANGADDWIPDQSRLSHGCVVIVHGLYGDLRDDMNESTGWPKACAAKIAAALGDGAPEVCLVDWHQVAHTAEYAELKLRLHVSQEEDILTDLGGVRPYAEEVANLVAFRLAAMITDEANPTILRDQPLHLIGHSAGGFIVARIALLLKKLNVAPTSFHVTILDTPAPTAEITTRLPDLYPDGTIDFYVSSLMGARRETFFPATFSPKIHKKVVTPPAASTEKKNMVRELFDKSINIWKEHHYAYEWYMHTIEDPASAPDEGFNRSPLLGHNKSTRTP